MQVNTKKSTLRRHNEAHERASVKYIEYFFSFSGRCKNHFTRFSPFSLLKFSHFSPTITDTSPMRWTCGSHTTPTTQGKSSGGAATSILH